MDIIGLDLHQRESQLCIRDAAINPPRPSKTAGVGGGLDARGPHAPTTQGRTRD